MSAQQAGAPSTADDKFRPWLAILVVTISVLGIIGVSVASILVLTGSDRTQAVRLVFAAVLPLFGTWVGTVLAFYFARENLKAATDSIRSTTESTVRLATLGADTPVTDAMIPRARIDAYTLQPNETVETVKLNALAARMSSKRQRMPIFDPGGAVLRVVHLATLTAYAATQGVTADKLPDTETIASLTGDLAKAIAAIAFVPRTATLDVARSAMEAVQGCNDVFVTTDGGKDDPVVGWITNTDLAQRS